MTSAARAAAFAWMLALFASPAFAQEPAVAPEPSETARFHWGVLRFTPSIAVSNLGVDSNVFNTADDPKQDTTAAVGPAVNLWMNLGPARLSGKGSGQYLYFRTYGNQRAWNTDDELRLDVPMARFKPFVAGRYVNTRQRPGFEIDARARAATDHAKVGAELRASGKTTFVVSGERSNIAFDERETFLGAALAQALNRRTDTGQVQFRYSLTPLTTFVVTNEITQDRFTFAQTKNADGVRVMPGFEFKPFALIAGKAFVGFRRLNLLSDTIPDFQGVVASVDTTYSVAATKVDAKVERDLVYSFELAEPYYALTDFRLSVTERISRNWDIVGTGGWQSLAYQGLRSALSPSRTDHVRQAGGGVGHRLGNTLRLGVDVNYLMRRSQDSFREYTGLQVGASVSYGLRNERN
jgi:hypothetical protein